METKTYILGSCKVVLDLEMVTDGDEELIFGHLAAIRGARGCFHYDGTFPEYEVNWLGLDPNEPIIRYADGWTVDLGDVIDNTLLLYYAKLSTAVMDLTSSDLNEIPAQIIAGFIRGDVKQFDEVVTTQSQLNELIMILTNAGEHDATVILMNHFAGRFGPPDLTL